MGHLRSIIHIGPPKTATTSLQESIIPALGRPYQVKPAWTRNLANEARFDPPRDLPLGVIVSDERLGGYLLNSPETIADRLSQVFADAIVVCVIRDPVELFYSLYRQRLLNGVALQRASLAQFGKLVEPGTADQYFDWQREEYSNFKRGFFATINLNSVQLAYTRYFEFHTVDFDLVRTNADAFVSAFAQACDISASPSISHANKTEVESMRAQLANEAKVLPPFYQRRYLEYFASPQLSSHREDFIRDWPYARKMSAFRQSPSV